MEGYQGNSEAMIWNWKVTSHPCPQSPRAARSLMPLSVPLAGVSQLFFRGSCSVRRCIFGVFVGGAEFRIFSCCPLGPISPRWGLSSCTWPRTAGLVLLPGRCSLTCSHPASQGSPPCSVTRLLRFPRLRRSLLLCPCPCLFLRSPLTPPQGLSWVLSLFSTLSS